MKIKIKHKLFFTLLLTSTVVAAGMFWFIQISFDRGFLHYVNRQELAQLEQLDQLDERLAKGYAEHGSWQFLIEDKRLWLQLHRDIFSLPSMGRHPEQGGGHNRLGGPQPPPGNLKGIGPRLVLFDVNKERVIGGPHDAVFEPDLKLKPVIYQSLTIGYLGLIPAEKLSGEGDLLFLEQQSESFALMAMAMAVLSLLLSYPMTIHLLRPIKELTGGTSKLIAGQFKTRISVMTNDELGQLSCDFNNLAMTLEENEKARQQWVADISHELRTPLAVLYSDIEALQDGIRHPSPQNLAILHEETVHLRRLVDDLYELSMSDIGALTYKKVMVDPVSILKGSIELFEQRLSQNKIRLTVDLPANLAISVLADPDRLQQLFTNLLENSLRYTDTPGLLEIHMLVNKSSVFFHFEDSAPSVSPSQLPKLFDRLYRGEESRNRTKGGAGLGLAICKNIVEAHHGKIDANISSLGGLDIKIEFPLRS
ncbi:MAG: two-component sensor histidine kinase [Deltaproteobacteria bacterium HGW-Deltaproteobacteria-4]|nr:MAG: two-component sensor histidine kinase [Deltaproteobacteria bacterium HGW-Deltaproteobacteria-4]